MKRIQFRGKRSKNGIKIKKVRMIVIFIRGCENKKLNFLTIYLY